MRGRLSCTTVQIRPGGILQYIIFMVQTMECNKADTRTVFMYSLLFVAEKSVTVKTIPT